VTLVISPLIALQQDQITRLEDFEAPDAVAINGYRTLSIESIRETGVLQVR
jgi:superfamily II DNA helicase RecQ